MDVITTYPEETIYVNHEIIHNTFIIRMFERRGVIFQSDITEIPPGSLIVISAHGTGPSYFRLLRERGIRWIDATCPLVEKVHREARDFLSRGYHILYIGKKWHQEAVGLLDEWGDRITLIENEQDIEKIPRGAESSPYALLTQTTLSVDDTALLIEKIQNRYPEIALPKGEDICYATTNRQKAVKVLAEKCNLILVVGSKSSSNSSKLRDIAEKSGAQAYLIDDATEIDPSWLEWVESIGITAWASGPESLVEGVIVHLESLGGEYREELRVVEERMEFPYVLKVVS